MKKLLVAVTLSALVAASVEASPVLLLIAKPAFVMVPAVIWVIQCGAACGGQRPMPR